MDQIISVSPQASAETVRRLLAQAQADRVIFELPDGWQELGSLAKLRLLQRQAQTQGKEVGLVARHGGTYRAARQLGVPIHTSARAFDRHPHWRMQTPGTVVNSVAPHADLPDAPRWRRKLGSKKDPIGHASRPRQHRSRNRRIRTEVAHRRPLPTWIRLAGYFVTSLIFAGLLASFALFVVPAATVVVSPGTARIERAVTLVANTGIEVADPELGLIPARDIQIHAELIGSAPTAGQEPVAVNKARGIVSFSNVGRQPVRIPAGTEVRTGTGNAVGFLTMRDAELAGQVGARVDVPIEAVEPGIVGNVRANSISTVAGSLTFQVRVINPQGTYGGSANMVRVVKQGDKDLLLEQVYAQAQADATDTLAAELGPGEWLVDESIEVAIIASIYDHFNDEPADELGLTLRVLLKGIAVDEREAVQAAQDDLISAIPDSSQLVTDSVAFSRQKDSTVSGQEVEFVMQAAGDYVVPIDPAELQSTVAGLPVQEAIQVIQRTWPSLSTPEIIRDPEWGDRMPRFPGRIQVRIEYASAATSAGRP